MKFTSKPTVNGEDVALASEVTEHVEETTDAHDASAISLSPVGLSHIVSTELQAAMVEVDAFIDEWQSIDAASIPVTPAGNISSTNVQASLQELDTEKSGTGHAHAGVYEPAGTVSTHAAASDPHTGYQKESEKGVASGYASLDANARVPNAELGTGTANSTTYLRGDRTWATVSGGGGSATIKEAELDFGEVPVVSKSFTVTDASITTTSKIIITQSAAAPTGKAADEAEMDMILFTGLPATGSMKVFAESQTGPVVGNFKTNYLIG